MNKRETLQIQELQLIYRPVLNVNQQIGLI